MNFANCFKVLILAQGMLDRQLDENSSEEAISKYTYLAHSTAMALGWDDFLGYIATQERKAAVYNRALAALNLTSDACVGIAEELPGYWKEASRNTELVESLNRFKAAAFDDHGNIPTNGTESMANEELTTRHNYGVHVLLWRLGEAPTQGL